MVPRIALQILERFLRVEVRHLAQTVAHLLRDELTIGSNTEQCYK
jgi:hypothetical protein